MTKWAALLLDTAAAAGIAKEEAATLVLTESNVEAYIEWDGNDLYPEDKIKIITSAWYQNGKLLEQGQCRKCSNEEEWPCCIRALFRGDVRYGAYVADWESVGTI